MWRPRVRKELLFLVQKGGRPANLEPCVTGEQAKSVMKGPQRSVKQVEFYSEVQGKLLDCLNQGRVMNRFTYLLKGFFWLPCEA